MKVDRKHLLTAILTAAFAPSLSAAAPGIDFDRGFDIKAVMENSRAVVQVPNTALADYTEEKCCCCEEPAYMNRRKGMMSVERIEGIGKVYTRILWEKADIVTIEELLKAGADPGGRLKLEEKTGIGHRLILAWVNRADLMRVKWISVQYSDLLEEAGVDTVKELRNRVPEHLLKRMTEINEWKRPVRRLPSLSQVEDWIIQARFLPPLLTY